MSSFYHQLHPGSRYLSEWRQYLQQILESLGRSVFGFGKYYPTHIDFDIHSHQNLVIRMGKYSAITSGLEKLKMRVFLSGP